MSTASSTDAHRERHGPLEVLLEDHRPAAGREQRRRLFLAVADQAHDQWGVQFRHGIERFRVIVEPLAEDAPTATARPVSVCAAPPPDVALVARPVGASP